MTVNSVRMPVGFGTRAIMSRGRPLPVMAHLKRSIIEVKVENDPDYKAYRQGRNIRPVVQKLLAETGISLTEGGGIPQLIKFQEHFR